MGKQRAAHRRPQTRPCTCPNRCPPQVPAHPRRRPAREHRRKREGSCGQCCVVSSRCAWLRGGCGGDRAGLGQTTGGRTMVAMCVNESSLLCLVTWKVSTFLDFVGLREPAEAPSWKRERFSLSRAMVETRARTMMRVRAHSTFDGHAKPQRRRRWPLMAGLGHRTQKDPWTMRSLPSQS